MAVTIGDAIAPLIEPDGSLDWIAAFVDVASAGEHSLVEIRVSASDLAWRSRTAGQPLPTEKEWCRCATHTDPSAARRILGYLHACRLRFDFKFAALAELCGRLTREFPDDGFLTALDAFAALGMRTADREARLTRALDATDTDSTCRFVCLHALWLGAEGDDQANRMFVLSEDMIRRGEDNSTLYFWRASALRRLRRLTEARVSIDQAIALLPPGENLIHQDYVRERELIRFAELLDQSATGAGQRPWRGRG